MVKREITIETTRGDLVVKYPTGGTAKKPADVGFGFTAVDLPNAMGMMIGAASHAIGETFKRVTSPWIIGTRGTRYGGDEIDYIPDNPLYHIIPNAESVHMLPPHSTIPVMFPNDRWLPPTDADIQKVRSLLEINTQLDEAWETPRYRKALGMFGNRNVPKHAPFGDTDKAWQLANYQSTAGGREREGYYAGVCPRGSGGYDNWDYNDLVWQIYDYLRNPTFQAYAFLMEQVTAHCAFGRQWSGKYAGLAFYSKGNNHIGENQPRHALEKQWSLPLLLMSILNRNPMCELQLSLMRSYLEKLDPKSVWKGFWGTRISSHYLEELMIQYLWQPEDWILDKVEEHITFVKTFQMHNLCFPNLGNGGNAPESPWMQCQLVTILHKWVAMKPGRFGAIWPVDHLNATGKAIWDLGSYRSDQLQNLPFLKYRFLTTDVPPASMFITGFAVPMLRWMAKTDNQFQALHDEVWAFMRDWIGSYNWDIIQGQPLPLEEMGYRHPPGGFGHPKAMKIALSAVL